MTANSKLVEVAAIERRILLIRGEKVIVDADLAASVLNSRRAVEVSVFVVRAFVKIRRVLSEHRALAQRLGQIERKLADHDHQIVAVVQAIRALLGSEPVPKHRRIGFKVDGEP